ncbi:hypothetical protein K7X08_024627 [Anisodus acutangulus]|uniref:Uncharacterized protein n=1 Tax=Anisodus acutangulus TaxID=402998 RepID=A0A9Q1MB85_9SOLA|nr:hypothetical protein K7X08_024627 [Anisodus acutangulus]
MRFLTLSKDPLHAYISLLDLCSLISAHLSQFEKEESSSKSESCTSILLSIYKGLRSLVSLLILMLTGVYVLTLLVWLLRFPRR